MEKPGIYKATSNAEPDKCFIFGVIDKDFYWKIVWDSLMKGKHPNRRLQNHLKANPNDEFTIDLIYPCSKQDLSKMERHFIKRLKPYFNFKGKTK